ncbi:metal-dependent transcriptional regulator [Actinomycetaceae bacterium TAE3-ERU4]|nr:metal-dependent transcriptional regulator [Actinomycetaceae bacterium TAE3-ERU4]
MSVSTLSASPQNYLKIIWALSEWSDQPVTTKLLGEKTGLRLSTISETVKKLTEKGLLHHEPYGAIELTEQGREYALAMIRRHRLIETFLVEVLDYGWEEVHAEAEHLEHAVSDLLIDRIDEYLGHPDRDPHGDPIPNKSGQVPALVAVSLDEAPHGQVLTVERIADSDPELLKFLQSQKIGVGVEIKVEPGPPFSDSLKVTGPTGEIDLGACACASIYVSLN